MARRNHIFAVDEYYHCYNRGTDKRTIFLDQGDYSYFLRSVESYNSLESFGKLRLSHGKNNQKLVEVLALCLLPNHYHIVLKEFYEHGISQFMKRVGVGYTMYFNEKYKRSGVLFQGTFKSKHITSDQDLRQVLSYVAFNNVIHSISDPQLYRNYLDAQFDPAQNRDRIKSSTMKEIVEIIKEQRLSFEEE